ncbi:DUF4276 family protein [Phenylobacterium sp.]|uniref:DUF4276 family protein n=1 Tax=Phenylobacterium sp. TaxID=1871053 RepID=UPI0035B4C8B7
MAIERLYIYCEGQTEEHFCGLLLASHFQSRGVEVRPILFPTKKGANARRHKGGWVRYDLARDTLVRIFRQETSDRAWVTTMADLYAIPADFPGLAAAPAAPPMARVAGLEAAWSQDLARDGYYRFTPYLQLHEFEALLLTSCEAIASAFPGEVDAGVALKADIGTLSPEEVNQGRETAPSKRIIRRFPEYEGMKTSAGPIIAAEIGLPALRAACPHFDEWLSRLEKAITPAAEPGPA